MKCSYYSLIAYGLTLLVWGTQAQAQAVSSVAAPTTYGQLADLVSQIAILKAQIQVVQLQQQIETAKRGADGAFGTDIVPALPNAPPALKSSGRGFSKPEIVSISGRGQNLTAILLMPDGGEVRVVAGTALGNGEHVRDVTPQAVQLSQDGKLIALPFIGGSLYAPGG